MHETSSRRQWIEGLAAGLLLLAGAVVMRPHGDLHTLGNVPPFLLGAAVMLAGFFGAVGRGGVPLAVIVVGAIAARALLLGQAPGDDIHRYLWEGRVLVHGFNPYVLAPDAESLRGLRDAGWEAVQHRTFTAIYPPLAEVIFAGMAALGAGVGWFKLGFAAADLLAGALLAWRFGGRAALVYLWNPLVIYAFAGGGHYDSLFVLALVLGWLAWDRGWFFAAVVALGAAVAIKWMAAPLLAWAGWRLLRERGVGPAVVAGFLGALPFAGAWALIGAWTGTWTTQLFPAQFVEFARSTELIPRLVAWGWEASRYQNGWFVLPLAVAWGVVILRARTFVAAGEWAFFWALVLSPLVHGWYFAWLMPFAVASRNVGSVLLAGTGFGYFVVYHRYEANPAAGWTFTPWEIALIWGPFVAGFLWTRLRAREGGEGIR